MTQCYSFRAALGLCLFVCLCTGVRAQTVIESMNFDGTMPEMSVATDVPFFDNNSDGFFGVLDNNSNPNDGAPTDTGDGGSTNPTASINASFLAGDYLYVRDLQDTGDSNGNDQNNGTDGFATVTFGPVDISGQTEVTFSFDYQIIGFETSDKALYELIIDGVRQGVVDLRANLSSGQNVEGSVSECILDGSTTVTLELMIKQNVESDQAAFDNFVVTAGTGCSPECGVTLDGSSLALSCDAFTAGNNDAVSGSLNYIGIDANITDVSIDNNATITADSDDPATEEGGSQSSAKEIRFTGLEEGQTYTVSLTGGSCTADANASFQFTVPTDLCQPVGDIVINEFLPRLELGGVGLNEFIEIYNRGTTDIDVSGYTIEEGSGAQNTIPDGTILGPGDGLTFGDTDDMSTGCFFVPVFGLSLNDSGDVIILRDDAGAILHQVSYSGTRTRGVSLALSPDGNVDGGFMEHTDVSSTGEMSSLCFENIDNSVALPVELISFTAAPTGKAVALHWTTANEIGNSHFDVQRSADEGRSWETIGAVAASDARSSAATYNYTDQQPVSGRSLYRLRQVDLDGTATLFDPVAVTFTPAELTVYPNPVTELLSVNIPADVTRLQLLGADGRVLQQLLPNLTQLNVTELAAGVYLLRAESAAGTMTTRFVKR